MTTKQATPSIFTSVVINARYIPVWVANAVLIVVVLALAPTTLGNTSFSVLLPLASFLAIAALGQMLVIMTGGIDLSVPGTMTLAAMIVVGWGGGQDNNLIVAIPWALAVGGMIGLVNGFLIGVLRLNALIVTLAVGQVVRGFTIEYAAGVANEAAVPDALSDWATGKYFGLSHIFWLGIVVTLLVTLFIRYSEIGRRFQSVGANPNAAWIAGIHVKTYIMFTYGFAGMFFALAGVLSAGLTGSPTLGLGNPYLLAPIAAVVIGGASLTGGLASVPSTWAAAFFLATLQQMLRVLGYSTNLQFVAFGAAIIGGMILSGERIVDMIEFMFKMRADPVGADAIPAPSSPIIPSSEDESYPDD
jgi:ribose/xylose/arabinose/galactoside ABC-type transport system permease subunit